MAATGATVGRTGLAVAPLPGEALERLSRWLLAAVALDLVLTRFLVRLAVFVPKGEPWATGSAVVGRVGAATDALVPIVGLLLLGALLVRAGRTGDRLEQAMLALLAVVAAGGLVLVYAPPTPAVVLVMDVLVIAVAVGAGGRIARAVRAPAGATLGLIALAGALAVAALARAVGVAGPGPSVGIVLDALGQVAFVAGAAMVGVAGVADLRRSGAARGRLATAGVMAAAFVLVAATGAPATWAALAIWSVGLAAVPGPLVAIPVGLAVAGLPALHRRAPAAAIGASIVLLAGYGLAASGLVLAGLLGLVVARSAVPAGSTT